MTHRPSPKKINNELNRLEELGDEFVLSDVAHRLNTTPQKIAAAIRMRGTAESLTPRNGRTKNNSTVYRFVKKGET